METISITNDVNKTIKEIYNLLNTNDIIKKDYTDYQKTLGIYKTKEESSKEYYIPYIFERRIPQLEKSPLEFFNQTNLQNDISKSMEKAFVSIFEIKKILKNGFDTYNIINEKQYKLNIMTKITDYRGIGIGQYVVARVFNYNDKTYIIEILGHIAESKKDEAMRYAMAKIIQEPYLVYEDNEEKQSEIEKNISIMKQKFKEAFETDEIITMNDNADIIIGEFNDFIENGGKISLEGKITEPEKLKFFEISDFENNYNNFVEKSLQGFSSHKKSYDVGIIFDTENGLYVIPFYKTILKIVEDNSLETVENAEECIKHFVNSETIPASILKRIYEKNKNLLTLINKVFEENLTFDEIIKKYKQTFLKHKIYSFRRNKFSYKWLYYC